MPVLANLRSDPLRCVGTSFLGIWTILDMHDAADTPACDMFCMKILTKDDACDVARAMLDKKALDVMLLEIAAVVPYADFFLLCSGRSVVQVKAIVNGIEEHFHAKGIHPLHIEGYSEGRWVLLDYDDLIVHVFLEEARLFYNLERLWGDVPRTVFEADQSGISMRSVS